MASAAGPDDQVVTIDGHRLKLTSLSKVLYPETGTTKADVLDYYARVATALITHASNRPVTRKRWVNGVGTADSPGEMFFQKNLDERSTPQWVLRRDIRHSDHTNSYPLVNDLATLIWLGQIAALELHVPQWQFGRTGIRKNPDRLVLDLDPGPGAGLAECAEVARLARTILVDMGLDPLPVTSGSKGIHLYAALDGRQTSEQVSEVAHELARALEADHPALIVSDMKKTLRDGKVLVDWSQNNGAKTTITPYSLRGRAHPTVAAPRTWAELESSALSQLDYTEVIDRVESIGDVLAPLTAGHLASLEPTPQRMAGFIPVVQAGGPDDRLATYRSMRDGAKTPEPVPEEAPPPTNGTSFVIQEHRARKLHYDFRLEHDGVLVSWAIPKGVPTDPGQNHLAVQTEDHPLAYGAFEGTIPAGQYGAGEVTIWDRGTYDLEKWRDGTEVIATLHGEKHGSHRYALIHTGGTDGGENNWLIHLMKSIEEQPPRQAKADSRRTVIGGDRAERAQRRTWTPMLASPGSAGELGDTAEWAFEMKWDGIRAIAEVSNGRVRLLSRNGVDITSSYPELQALVGMLRADAVLDGEIIALNKAGRPDFGVLQTRMKLTRPRDVELALATTPIRYMVFDVLASDGDSLTDTPWQLRRATLERILRPSGAVQLPPVFDGDVRAALETSRTLGLEGIMAKRRTSTYLMGKRTRSWVKIKHNLSQEVVIGGWRPGSGARAHHVGSLLMGIPGENGLHYVGRVGSGFTEKQLDELGTRLRRLERKSSPFLDVPAEDAADARWVTPSLVGEVAFSDWTRSGRLRHPSWRGWRPDKTPDDVHREN